MLGLYIVQPIYHIKQGDCSRAASAEVELQLVISKYYPALFYGLGACVLNKEVNNSQSIEFAGSRLFSQEIALSSDR